MAGSATRTGSFTATDARYVASKMAADLRVLHNLYGQPRLDVIDDYAIESALLLRDGYLNTVDFGFRAGGEWRLRLRYTATAGGQLLDNPPGRLPAAVTITGATFHSFLTYSPGFDALSSAERAAVTASLPVTRVSGVEPTTGGGTSTGGRGYARNGAGVSRDVYYV